MRSWFIEIVICLLACRVHGFRCGFNNRFLQRAEPKRSSTSLSMSLALKILEGVVQNFDESEVYRVAQCWDRFARGQNVERNLDGNLEVVQSAECFVEGLSAMPFHDVNNYPWAIELGKNYKEILDELVAYENKIGSSVENEWLGARDSEGSSYGPEWKTLALQDRGNWDEGRAPYFSKTVQLLKDLEVPSMEAFFARQGPNSGIKPHSDKNNFIITCHVALDVPEGQCWIKVGDQKYYWKNGEACVFDTSVVHSTFNEADVSRKVLLIRFWHPEVTPTERAAFKFIFDYLDHAAYGEDALEQFEMQHMLMGKDQHKGLQVNDRVALEEEMLSRKKKKGKAKGSSATGGKKGFG